MLGDTAKEVIELLEGAGVERVAMDAAKLDLPGALVLLQGVDADRLSEGVLTSQWEVYLIARDEANYGSLNSLGEMLSKVRHLAHEGEFEVTTLLLQNQGTLPHPAIRFSIIVEST